MQALVQRALLAASQDNGDLSIFDLAPKPFGDLIFGGYARLPKQIYLTVQVRVFADPAILRLTILLQSAVDGSEVWADEVQLRRQKVNDANAAMPLLETWRGRQAAGLCAGLGAAPAIDPDATAAQAGHLPDWPWSILKQLVLAISRQIPLVCTAGVDAESQLIYPACLAANDNGIIAVGP